MLAEHKSFSKQSIKQKSQKSVKKKVSKKESLYLPSLCVELKFLLAVLQGVPCAACGTKLVVFFDIFNTLNVKL
jgi:hypothetical protein